MRSSKSGMRLSVWPMQREREMFAVNFLVRIFAGEPLRLLQGLLRFEGELFRLHKPRLNLTQRCGDAKTRN